MIYIQDIKMKIVSFNKADMNFKMNFIAFLINCFGKRKHPPVELQNKEDKTTKNNWCSYLIECLVKTKQSFDPSSATSNFSGPSVYLVVRLITLLLFQYIYNNHM